MGRWTRWSAALLVVAILATFTASTPVSAAGCGTRILDAGGVLAVGCSVADVMFWIFVLYNCGPSLLPAGITWSC